MRVYCSQVIKVSAVCWRETIPQQAQHNTEKPNSIHKIPIWKHWEYFLSLVQFKKKKKKEVEPKKMKRKRWTMTKYD